MSAVEMHLHALTHTQTHTAAPLEPSALVTVKPDEVTCMLGVT